MLQLQTKCHKLSGSDNRPCCFTVPEAGSLRPRCPQGWLFPTAVRGTCPRLSSPLVDGCLPSLPLCAQIPAPFKDTSHLIRVHPPFHLIISIKSLSPNKVVPAGMGLELQHIFCGDTIQSITGTHRHRLNEYLKETQKHIPPRLGQVFPDGGWARNTASGQGRERRGNIRQLPKGTHVWHRMSRES